MNLQPAGYSDKPLVDKLGYQPGDSVYLVNEPDDFHKYISGEGMDVSSLPARWVHAFFLSQAELQAFLDTIDLNQIEKGFWVSWPKKSSGIETDINEQTFRDFILPIGWVDTKVAAIDNKWSGLKFLRRRNT